MAEVFRHSQHCDMFPRTVFETTFTKIVGGMATKIRCQVKDVLKRQILEITR